MNWELIVIDESAFANDWMPKRRNWMYFNRCEWFAFDVAPNHSAPHSLSFNGIHILLLLFRWLNRRAQLHWNSHEIVFLFKLIIKLLYQNEIVSDLCLAFIRFKLPRRIRINSGMVARCGVAEVHDTLTRCTRMHCFGKWKQRRNYAKWQEQASSRKSLWQSMKYECKMYLTKKKEKQTQFISGLNAKFWKYKNNNIMNRMQGICTFLGKVDESLAFNGSTDSWRFPLKRWIVERSICGFEVGCHARRSHSASVCIVQCVNSVPRPPHKSAFLAYRPFGVCGMASLAKDSTINVIKDGSQPFETSASWNEPTNHSAFEYACFTFGRWLIAVGCCSRRNKQEVNATKHNKAK